MPHLYLKMLPTLPFNECFNHVHWILSSCSESGIHVVILKGLRVDDFVVNLFITFGVLSFSIKCVY